MPFSTTSKVHIILHFQYTSTLKVSLYLLHTKELIFHRNQLKQSRDNLGTNHLANIKIRDLPSLWYSTLNSSSWDCVVVLNANIGFR